MADPMVKQLRFIESLHDDLQEDTKKLVSKKGEYKGYLYTPCYGDKNCGKTALKRKITMLRQELLNLERMIDRC